MALLRTIIIIAIIGYGCSLKGQKNVQDILFIQVDSMQTIYVDHSRSNALYSLMDADAWTFLGINDLVYQNSLDFLKGNNGFFIKKTPVLPFTRWLPLKQYKGDFYIYSPCDFSTFCSASVNDTTFIDWIGGNPTANIITEQKAIDNTTYEFRLTGVYDQDRKIAIHILDNNKGIAVFEESVVGKPVKHYLMVSADKLERFPIIVNTCKTPKAHELDFVEPDYAKLLKQN